jgi:di/tricarboxylate transporter
MLQNRQRRRWFLIAAIAISIALVLMLVPHGHSGNSADGLAILLLLFVGIISPLSQLSPLSYVYAGRVPDAPVLPSRFQRPPPFTLA